MEYNLQIAWVTFADGVSDYAITVYNEQVKFEKTIEISDYKDDFFNTAISQIYVNGQYLFITNFMDTTLIGGIEDGEIKKIQLEKNLSIAQNSMPSYKKPVLYMRESSIFYAFDKEKGKILITEMENCMYSETDNKWIVNCRRIRRQFREVIKKS